jgi:hypothetical protein
VRLEEFIEDHPGSDLKASAYSMIAGELVRTVKDTTRFNSFAREIVRTESDGRSKATMFYWLYRTNIETRPDQALAVGKELLSRPTEDSWIYNYIGYDLAERGLELDLALPLTGIALDLAENRDDSAGYIDSRGWIYYKKGMYEEASRDLEKAVDIIEEPDEEILMHLAYTYLRGGNSSRAFEAFKSILVKGEYDYARTILDSLMIDLGYSAREKRAFEESIWGERIAAATPAQGFRLPTLTGDSHEFDPLKTGIKVINFMTPT